MTYSINCADGKPLGEISQEGFITLDPSVAKDTLRVTNFIEALRKFYDKHSRSEN